MSVNMYVRATPLYDVVGRIHYATRPESQHEKLIAVVGKTDSNFWRELAEDCQVAFTPRVQETQERQPDGSIKTVLHTDQCCEGRELVVALPNCFLVLSRERQEEILLGLAELIRSMTGTDNVVAAHDSHAGQDEDGNAHIHVIFAERVRLPRTEIIKATRAQFYDESGKRVYKKTLILDDTGQLRPGCKIVPKGSILHVRHFGPKVDGLDQPGMLRDIKLAVADWINRELQPDELREVYDPAGPYLAQWHQGKPRYNSVGEMDRAQVQVEIHNRLVRAYNAYVRQGVVTSERAADYKTRIALAPGADAQVTELQSIVAEIELMCRDISSTEQAALEEDVAQTGLAPRGAAERDEVLKRQLRALYRQGSLDWQAYRAAGSDVDRKILLAKARETSASIDRLKRRMGYDVRQTVYERQQSVWEASREIRAMDRERSAKESLVRAQKATAWQRVQDAQVKMRLARRRKAGDPIRDKAQAELNDAMANYVQTKKTATTWSQADKLLREYKAFAMRLAENVDVPEADLERARQRYLAAARRLQEPKSETVKELQRQLKDLHKSQEIRDRKREIQAKEQQEGRQVPLRVERER